MGLLDSLISEADKDKVRGFLDEAKARANEAKVTQEAILAELRKLNTAMAAVQFVAEHWMRMQQSK